MLDAREAIELAGTLRKDAAPEWARLNRFSRYATGRQKGPWLPDSAETEYKDIAKKSASNWLDLVVRSTAQGLYVVGYGDRSDESVTWEEGWQRNGMDARQHALFRAALVHGYAYLIVMPSDDGVWCRPDSATNVWAHFDDPFDDWAEYAVREVRKNHLELYDDEGRYSIIDGEVTFAPHRFGRCPVVRVQKAIDLIGPPQGEIEPVIPIQDRIVDATFNLQMVSKYGAFPQRWIAGLDPSAPLVDESGLPLRDDDGNLIYPKIKAYVDSILTAVDPNTKFGQFTAADLAQFVNALEAHIRHLAAITQTPPHYLLGSLVNLSAEALAAAEAGLQRKIKEIRDVLGEGIEQAMRLMAHELGDEVAAEDPTARVRWRDVESRSFAQVADALVKLDSIGVPKRKLFELLPGWTDDDVEEAVAESKTELGMAAFAEIVTPAPQTEAPAA